MSFTTKSRIKMQNSGSKQKKPPKVVHKTKPRAIIDKLSDDHAEHLHNISHGGLMRKVTPTHIEVELLKHGYIRRAVGGLMPTEVGFKALMLWQKGKK